jgi:hypothetical protein
MTTSFVDFVNLLGNFSQLLNVDCSNVQVNYTQPIFKGIILHLNHSTGIPAQPQLALGVGGTTFVFADMLNDYRIATEDQALIMNAFFQNRVCCA